MLMLWFEVAIIFIFIYTYIYIYIYIYIYKYIYMVFITEGFFEVAIESWPEWDIYDMIDKLSHYFN